MNNEDKQSAKQYLGNQDIPAWRWYASNDGTDKKAQLNFCSKTRSEYFAELILKPENFNRLGKISENGRTLPYIQKNHDGKTLRTAGDSTREEEHIALALFRATKDEQKTFAHIGRIVDYQTPLKKAQSDKGIGKIDLLAYHESDKTLYLLELKRAKSVERLLRAALEIYSYSKLLVADKIKEELKERGCDVAQIKPAVLLFADSSAYNEYVNNESPNTIALMQKLGVGFYGIRETGDGYEVFVP